MRVALAQIGSGNDVARNLDRALALVEEAAGRGCDLVAFPEAMLYRGPFRPEAIEPANGPWSRLLAEASAGHSIAILAGGYWTWSGDPERPHNTATLFVGGEAVARYHKIHLFDLDMPNDSNQKESRHTTPGRDLVTADVAGWKFGITICFDLRFPRMYQILSDRGVDVITVPSSFSAFTGRDHWEVLLRARAIETRAYVIAPAQVGPDETGWEAYGHSMVVDPWGRVVTAADGSTTGLVVADLDPAQIEWARSIIPRIRSPLA